MFLPKERCISINPFSEVLQLIVIFLVTGTKRVQQSRPMLGKNSMILVALCTYTPCQSPKEPLASSHKQRKAQTISFTFRASKTTQNTRLKPVLFFPAACREIDARCPASEAPSLALPQALPGARRDEQPGRGGVWVCGSRRRRDT